MIKNIKEKFRILCTCMVVNFLVVGTVHANSPGVEDLPKQKTVKKDGVTWTFSEEVPVGQFVTGDYYVVGPVTIVNIDPLPTKINGRHGSALNLDGSKNGVSPFDDRTTGNRYRENMRSYPPIVMTPGDVLISSISIGARGDFRPWLRESNEIPESYVKSVSVLHVLAEPVSEDTFRPGYVGGPKLWYYANDLHRNLLPQLEKVNNIYDINKMAEHFSRPWLDVCYFGFDAAVEYQAVYGREVGRSVGMGSLALMLDFTAEEKEDLLIGMVQYAIDLWHIAHANYPGWPAHGGHGSGRKWPLIFAGILLDDPEMMKPSETFPELRFAEDMHTAYDNSWTGANVVYTGHQGLWNGVPVSPSPHWGPYEHMHPSEWKGTFNNVSNWNIGENYRRCCTSVSWVGQALGARIMGAEEFWGHDAFFDYVDRWMTEDDSDHVQIMKNSAGIDYSAGWQSQGQAWDSFVNNMWATYRNNLPPSVLSDDMSVADKFSLEQNYPNPFYSLTTIDYALPVEGHVTLNVYDIIGRKVANLINENKAAGSYTVEWNGSNDNGQSVGSGIYFYQLKTDCGYVESKKVLKLK